MPELSDFEKARKILDELEKLELGKIRGALYEKTKRSLRQKLTELSSKFNDPSYILSARVQQLPTAQTITTPAATVAVYTPTRTARTKLREGQLTTHAHITETAADRDKKEKEEAVKLLKHSLKKFKKKIRKAEKEKRVEKIELRRANFYVRLGNFLFRGVSTNFLRKGNFSKLAHNVRRANLNILVHSYLSLLFITTILAFIFGFGAGFFFTFLKIKFSLLPPPITFVAHEFSVSAFVRNLVIYPLLFSSLTFLVTYYYPNLEASAKKNKINDELPFALIHMSAIAGSGVEPTRIFQIVSEGGDYKDFSREARKVVNKINLYGYDLLTALKESAKNTPSEKVKDLFNGMTSIIATGGDLKLYLEKKAEDSMVEYKLSRKKFAEAADIYADIYTGILIAAPLIFGVMIAVMAPLGGKFLGLSIEGLSLLGLVTIVFLNILFLVLMNIAQPSE